ncbi:MAG: Phosphorylase [Gammaproteobacteria bacterium]|nr:Phosphorylase [Gammaproteobacteria bacterium]
MRHLYLASLLIILCMAADGTPAAAAETLDRTPRTAIMSAFEPEWIALQSMLAGRKDYAVHGTVFLTGTIEHKPVLLFQSGVSMVNAAMKTQLAIDRFTIRKIAFSGIAGGVDTDLEIGDVVVPDAWGEYLETVFAREKDGAYTVPEFEEKRFPNFGMMFPQPVQIATGGRQPEKRFWFPVDPQLLAVARRAMGAVALQDCTPEHKCLLHKPKIVIGGHGVSGQAFVDNAAFREYARKTFDARVLDMESAAVAHVAYANGVPFIAFRSLSDLAGGGPGENEMGTFFQLASDNSAAFVREFLKQLP